MSIALIVQYLHLQNPKIVLNRQADEKREEIKKEEGAESPKTRVEK